MQPQVIWRHGVSGSTMRNRKVESRAAAGVNSFGHPLRAIKDLLVDTEVFQLAVDILHLESHLITGHDTPEDIVKFVREAAQSPMHPVPPSLRSQFFDLMGGEAGIKAIRN